MMSMPSCAVAGRGLDIVVDDDANRPRSGPAGDTITYPLLDEIPR